MILASQPEYQNAKPMSTPLPRGVIESTDINIEWMRNGEEYRIHGRVE